jgi:hypothetical protein
MAWDSTRRYYYRSVWTPSGPRRVYVGGGPLGELAAREQAQRAAQAAQRRQGRAADASANQELDAQYRRLRAFVWALLTAAGCYQHNREWRRMDLKAFARRYREAEERDAARTAGKTAHAGGPAQLAGPVTADRDRAQLEADAVAALEALVKRVNGPKPSRADLDTLREVLAMPKAPGGAVVTFLSGWSVLDHILDKWGGSAAARIVMRADAERMAQRLGRDSAPPFERPLIDHIVTCWVRLQLVERDHVSNTAGAHSRDSGTYWDRRLSEAQRRYLRAVNLLAKLRHMGPAVQVNVANQQVVMNGRTEPD